MSDRRPTRQRPGASRRKREVVGGERGTDLRSSLRDIDGGPYGAYRRILGTHALGEFRVIVDSVPPDPFAGSARVRLVVDRVKTGLPDSEAAGRERRIGFEDFVARIAAEALAERSGRSHEGPGSGRVGLQRPGPAMIERSTCRISADAVELRLLIDLPAAGRRVRGMQASRLFFEDLPRLATSTLLFSSRQLEAGRRHADAVEDHAFARRALEAGGLVAFVGDGALLARAGGADEGPRRDGREVAFAAPPSLAVTLELPHAGAVRGMGIPAGVTVIVGGAFHGKSTLLDAIAAGVYPHRPGDGRERTVTIPQTTVLVSEDGRSVRRVDISGFLGRLPTGVRSADFSTDKASGSTSQAASLAEAMELGTRLVLIDEDTAATNFMIRDGRMQRLVERPAEPIFPYIDRVRALYEGFGISTILVTGGSGDYLEVADTVIFMRDYRASEATERAREVVDATRSMRIQEPLPPLRRPASRQPRAGPAGTGRRRVSARGPRAIRVGDETVDLAALRPLAEVGQVRALARLFPESMRRMETGVGMAELVEALERFLDEHGVDALDRPVAYDLSRPRGFEIASMLNRWRGLRVERSRGDTEEP